MTTETQTFISLSDIRGIRVECTSCKIQMIVSLATKMTQRQAQFLTGRFKCPHCNAEWFAGAKDSRLLALENFVKYLVEMQNRTKEFGTDGVNMVVTLQIGSQLEGA